MNAKYIIMLLFFIAEIAVAQISPKLQSDIEEKAKAIEQKVIAWRRDFHQYPELSNREFKTGKKIAEHLRSLKLEVKYPVAKTGVVGILRTGRPGPTIALRADIDALPVVERTPVPFASIQKTTYLGQEVGVMHACGHDTHIAILMGVAEIFANIKSSLKGNIVFLFQPAEEGAPEGEEGGAALMIKEGALDDPKVDVVFGLHISSETPVGIIAFRSGGLMAAVDELKIKVMGRQAHGSKPWAGVDPVTTSAQIITGLQTIVSRQLDLTAAPAVLTVATVHGGVRSNIIPEEVNMTGTLRTLDNQMREELHTRIKKVAENIAEGMGAKAEVNIKTQYPVTYNSPKLTAWAKPIIESVTGKGKAVITKPITGAEDFSFYAQKVPGFFFFVGGMPPNADPATVPSHHTPDFYIDESGLITGLRAMLNLAVNYMYNPM